MLPPVILMMLARTLNPILANEFHSFLGIFRHSEKSWFMALFFARGPQGPPRGGPRGGRSARGASLSRRSARLGWLGFGWLSARLGFTLFL